MPGLPFVVEMFNQIKEEFIYDNLYNHTANYLKSFLMIEKMLLMVGF